MLSLFSCCHRRQPTEESLADEPNERSHLIPATSQPEPVIPIYVDPKETARARLHARMAKVVKSKESKMVNISARLPFNLRNQDLGAPSLSHSRLAHLSDPPSSSTSSPSPSPYTSPPPFDILGPSNSSKNHHVSPFAFADPSSATPHSHGEVQAQVGGPLTAVGATAQLPGVVSRTPSRSSRARELSTDALLSPGDDDNAVGRDEDGDGSSSSRTRRVPLLGARLVKGPPIDQIKSWLQVDNVASTPNGKGKSPALASSLHASPVPRPSPSPSYTSLRGRTRRGASTSSSLRGGFGTSAATAGGSSLHSGELEVPGAEDLELTLDTTDVNVTSGRDEDEDPDTDMDLHTPTIDALAQTPKPGYFVSPPSHEASSDNNDSGSQHGLSPAPGDTNSTSSIDRGRTREPTPLVLEDTEPLIVHWGD